MQLKNVRSQNDIVANMVAETKENEFVEKLRVPGLEKMHEMTKQDLGEALANILKSRTGITKLSWEIGKPYIELTISNK